MATFNVRLRQRHDTEANWILHPDFVPMSGEIIIYDPDENYAYARYKTGVWDGVSEVTDDMKICNLPFSNAPEKISTSDIDNLF